ncbi:MAG: protein-export chaperone SecB [Paracoccaceae bacterium]|nr:protein-export chaperone SecB [Paracoccaceae bacterium]MDG2259828.1 protein-export chaperone SecB [Paracoccaceae bacterium]
MAENGVEAGAEAQAAVPPKMSVMTQFIRDLSFENILAQKGVGGEVQPEVDINVNLEPRNRSAENQYEVAMKLQITSKNKGSDEKLFILELDYAGIFHIENVPQEQMHPYLLIECPRMIFPFVRRIVHDVTRDGGFPPLNMETIDFLALYRTELTKRAEEMKAQKADA